MTKERTEKFGRFDHHPDPAIDFEIEVQCIEARLFDAMSGISKPGTEPEKVPSVLASIERAMDFRVGAVSTCVSAKARLRFMKIQAEAFIEQFPCAQPEVENDLVERLLGHVADFEDDLRQTIAAKILPDRAAYGENQEVPVSLLSAVAARIQALEAELARKTEALTYAHKGLDMVHNGLMDPTRPRQAVGEVCFHFLDAGRAALTEQS